MVRINTNIFVHKKLLSDKNKRSVVVLDAKYLILSQETVHDASIVFEL